MMHMCFFEVGRIKLGPDVVKSILMVPRSILEPPKDIQNMPAGTVPTAAPSVSRKNERKLINAQQDPCRKHQGCPIISQSNFSFVFTEKIKH